MIRFALSIALVLSACGGDPIEQSPTDAQPAETAETISDGGIEAATDTAPTTVDDAADAAPPRAPCAMPVAGATKCPSGGCTVEEISSGHNAIKHLTDGGSELFFSTTDSGSTSGWVERLNKATREVANVASGSYPSGIALSDTEIFWGHFDNLPTPAWGAIRRKSRDLDASYALVVASKQTLVDHIAYAKGYVFWPRGGEGLMRVSATGGTPTLVVPGVEFGPVVAENDLVFIEIDPTTRAPWLSKMPIPSGPVARLSSLGFAAGAHTPAWDSGWAVWSDESAGTIKRACTDEPGEVTSIAVGQSSPWPVAIRDGSVYWAERAGSLKRAPLAGGDAVVLATGLQNVISIVVDAEWVYFADFNKGTISRTPR
jgi:hypothetical protein